MVAFPSVPNTVQLSSHLVTTYVCTQSQVEYFSLIISLGTLPSLCVQIEFCLAREDFLN